MDGKCLASQIRLQRHRHCFPVLSLSPRSSLILCLLPSCYVFYVVSPLLHLPLVEITLVMLGRRCAITPNEKYSIIPPKCIKKCRYLCLNVGCKKQKVVVS